MIRDKNQLVTSDETILKQENCPLAAAILIMAPIIILYYAADQCNLSVDM